MKRKEQILKEILSTEPNEVVTTEELICDYEFYNKLLQANLPHETDDFEFDPAFLRLRDHRN